MYPDNGFLIVVPGANFSYYSSTRKGAKGANIYTLEGAPSFRAAKCNVFSVSCIPRASVLQTFIFWGINWHFYTEMR